MKSNIKLTDKNRPSGLGWQYPFSLSPQKPNQLHWCSVRTTSTILRPPPEAQHPTVPTPAAPITPTGPTIAKTERGGRRARPMPAAWCDPREWAEGGARGCGAPPPALLWQSQPSADFQDLQSPPADPTKAAESRWNGWDGGRREGRSEGRAPDFRCVGGCWGLNCLSVNAGGCGVGPLLPDLVVGRAALGVSNMFGGLRLSPRYRRSPMLPGEERRGESRTGR